MNEHVTVLFVSGFSLFVLVLIWFCSDGFVLCRGFLCCAVVRLLCCVAAELCCG